MHAIATGDREARARASRTTPATTDDVRCFDLNAKRIVQATDCQWRFGCGVPLSSPGFFRSPSPSTCCGASSCHAETDHYRCSARRPRPRTPTSPCRSGAACSRRSPSGGVPKWLRERSAKPRCSGSNPLAALPFHSLPSQRTTRAGVVELGRHTGLKTPWGFSPVRVRLPPPAFEINTFRSRAAR
jgi:hypothetical protein